MENENDNKKLQEFRKIMNNKNEQEIMNNKNEQVLIFSYFDNALREVDEIAKET